jgi:hypothetical protein
MSEGSEQEPPRTGGENAGVDSDVAGQGDEGRRTAQATPPIDQDAEPGQTSSPAPPDDVGVPSDEEISAGERAARDEP